MDLHNTLKREALVVILRYTHNRLLIFCLHAMKVLWKHGVLYIYVNVLLGLERLATLKKWLDSINPFIPSRPIESIKTNALEAIHPCLLWSLCDDGNDSEDKMVLINNALVDVLHFALASKGLC